MSQTSSSQIRFSTGSPKARFTVFSVVWTSVPCWSRATCCLCSSADFGADVIKVEPPNGDRAKGMDATMAIRYTGRPTGVTSARSR
jgi:hypothetical protein